MKPNKLKLNKLQPQKPIAKREPGPKVDPALDDKRIMATFGNQPIGNIDVEYLSPIEEHKH